MQLWAQFIKTSTILIVYKNTQTTVMCNDHNRQPGGRNNTGDRGMHEVLPNPYL